MIGKMNGAVPEQIGFLLLDRFSMMAFTSAVEPLRIANRAAGLELYRWQIASVDGVPARASNGLALVADRALSSLGGISALVVVASFEPERHAVRSTLAQLRRLARFGVAMGALDTGAWPLAAAGLLDGYRVTLHWEAAPAFASAFPNVMISPHLYEIDRDRFTSAGGTSPFDMMLYLIGRRHGDTLARSIAEQLVSAAWRPADLPQRPPLSTRIQVRDRRLAMILTAIDENPAAPWTLAAIASRAGMSVRRLTELFQRETGNPPHRFVLQLRLRRARTLLESADHGIREVADACGFASPEHFSRSFRRAFGVPPSAVRRG